MKNTGKCPKCGGVEIIADAMAVDHSAGGGQLEMTIATFRKPEALVFKQKTETTVSAWVCSSCGFVEFYADNPRSIKIKKA